MYRKKKLLKTVIGYGGGRKELNFNFYGGYHSDGVLIDTEFFAFIIDAIVKHVLALQTLKACWHCIDSLPSSIGKLQTLTRLDLSDNKLTLLPDSFCNLTALIHLNLSCNKLVALPVAFGNLTALQTLNVRANCLSALPDSVCNLTALWSLQLPNNCLTSLPDNVGQLLSLQILDCRYNRVIALPQSICTLSNLVVLNVVGNQIASLPTHIGHLTALSSLHLSHNRLSQLPASIVYLDKCLQRVTLSHNLVSATTFNYQIVTFRFCKKRRHAWRRRVINAYRLALTLWRSRDDSALSTLDVGGTALAVFALLCKADKAPDFSDVCLEGWQLQLRSSQPTY